MSPSKDSSLEMKQLRAVHRLGTRLPDRRVERCKKISFDWRFLSIRSVSDVLESSRAAWLTGIFLHIVHFCFYISRIRSPNCDLEWETYSGNCDASSISWVRVLDTAIIAILVEVTLILVQAVYGSIVLICVSFAQTWLISTRYKICHISNTRSPYASNACLLVWYPNKFELTLFCVHSPAHSLLWMAVTHENLFRSTVVIAILCAQVSHKLFNQVERRSNVILSAVDYDQTLPVACH